MLRIRYALVERTLSMQEGRRRTIQIFRKISCCPAECKAKYVMAQ